MEMVKKKQTKSPGARWADGAIQGGLKARLDAIYSQYNKRCYVDPDPLAFLYKYSRARDREIAGLIAASLAYGRVEMIMAVVETVLGPMGQSPREWLLSRSEDELASVFKGFKYRFAREDHLAALLTGMRRVILDQGSMENCFIQGLGDKKSIMDGLLSLYKGINAHGECGHLLADPSKSSACKRSHLFLRWMVRKDAVDPGGWDGVDPSLLVVPLDTHMFKVGRFLGFTQKKSAGRSAAVDITDGFAGILPSDPVKYDFALTRFGIRRNMDMDGLKDYLSGE